ncbi:glycosyltransferase family 4 protein [Zooshikella marina]|uniref:glycosyltransferase family 4 protein n=1 Tax=Zooshikella ganghwensis TaxID=202772 RepID=UPI001BB09BF6|nr:glycosyltransferase family 4 protein [Zooshikella ganghwensis]MBU2707297.1 glycosyltransferase family 4 protein [Zooshikella ganghwensis]
MEKFSFLTSYYKPKPGGLCKRYFRAISALLDRGHTVHYISTEPFPISHSNLFFHKIPYKLNTSGFLFWIYFTIITVVYSIIITNKHSIDKFFSFHYYYTLLFKLATNLFKKESHLFIRADSITNNRILNKSKLLIYFEKLLEGLSIHNSFIYPVSITLEKNIINRHKILKPLYSQVLYNEIKTPYSHSKVPSDTLRFCFVGILEPRKQPLMLVDIFNTLQKKNCILNIYGKGPLEDLIKSSIKNNKIIYKGWVRSDRIWINNDILLHPSLHEGCPNSVLEAISNNTLVIASDIEEHREIIPREQLILNQKDSWTKIILQLTKNRLDNSQQEKKSSFLCFNWEHAICSILTENQNV